MLKAITREVSPALGRCELTHLPRTPIDVPLACRQHDEYCGALARLGCSVLTLPAEPDFPDSVFVEDTAVVLDEVAIIMRPGAAARRGETSTIEQALAPDRRIDRLETPATIDGGDVLLVGRTLFVGLSSRTNAQGVAGLAEKTKPYGYEVRSVPVAGCLHLKSACTAIGPSTLLINPDRVDPRDFGDLEFVPVDPDEPDAANALPIGAAVLYASGYPRTCERLAARGMNVELVDIGELARAEGAVTCSSLVFEVGSSSHGVVAT